MASARAIAMRWRCPPENCWGKPAGEAGVEADRFEPPRDVAGGVGAAYELVRDPGPRRLRDRRACADQRCERILEHHLDTRRALHRPPTAMTGSRRCGPRRMSAEDFPQ